MRVDDDVLQGLMNAALDGDAAAYASLLRRLVPLLRGFYRRRLRGDDDDIEDLVQETLMAVHTRRSTYDRDRPFGCWLFAIARYNMIDRLRRGALLQSLDGREDEIASDGFEDDVAARIDVEDLLATLSAKQSRVIRATRILGFSVAETAQADGIGESDVKVSVHRGLRALMARVQGGRR